MLYQYEVVVHATVTSIAILMILKSQPNNSVWRIFASNDSPMTSVYRRGYNVNF